MEYHEGKENLTIQGHGSNEILWEIFEYDVKSYSSHLPGVYRDIESLVTEIDNFEGIHDHLQLKIDVGG